FLLQLLGARGGVGDDEAGVVVVHWQRAGDDHLSREITGLLQDIIDPRPVDGEQDSVRVARRLSRRPGSRRPFPLRLAGERLELPFGPRVAEDHVVPGVREDRAELPTHQPGAQDADAHGHSFSPWFGPWFGALPRGSVMTRCVTVSQELWMPMR